MASSLVDVSVTWRHIYWTSPRNKEKENHRLSFLKIIPPPSISVISRCKMIKKKLSYIYFDKQRRVASSFAYVIWRRASCAWCHAVSRMRSFYVCFVTWTRIFHAKKSKLGIPPCSVNVAWLTSTACCHDENVHVNVVFCTSPWLPRIIVFPVFLFWI